MVNFYAFLMKKNLNTKQKKVICKLNFLIKKYKKGKLCVKYD